MFHFTHYMTDAANESLAYLLDASLKVTIVFAMAAGTCVLLRRHSAAVRHHVWAIAIGVSLVTPLATGLLPQFTLAILPSSPRPTSVNDTAQATTVASGETSNSSTPAELPISAMNESFTSAVAMGEVKSGDSRPAMSEPATTSEFANAQQFGAATGTRGAVVHRIGQGAEAFVILAWLVGALLITAPFLHAVVTQWLRMRGLRRVEDTDWNASVATVSRMLGLRRGVETLETTRDDVPAVVGILRTRILVPANWRDWSASQRQCILLHELAHVKRFDVATQLLGRFVAIVHWFNPLAWYAVRRLRIERELACDDCVLLTGQRASDYAAELLRMLQSYRPKKLAVGVAMAHSARIDQRVIAILDSSRSRQPVARSTAGLLLLAASLVVGILGGATVGARSVDESNLTTATGTEALDTTSQDKTAKADKTTGQKETGRQETGRQDTAETLTFTGQVLHGDKPIVGATITLWQRIGPEGFYDDWHPRESIDAEPRFAAVSDENGQFEFTFSAREMTDTPWNIWRKPWEMVQVVVAKEGMGVGWCTLGQLKTRKKIWIRGTVPLRGRVIDLEGRPVAGGQIRFHFLRDEVPSYQELWQPTWTGLSQDIVTDDDGRFVIVGLPTNRKGIRLSVSGPTIATKIFAFNTSATEGESVEVIVEPTKPIVGTVRDSETGEPVSGIAVYGNEEGIHRLVRAVTDDRGEYRLIGLPKSKQYQLTARAPFSRRYLVRYSSVIDSPGLAPITHDMRVRRGVPVHVTVVDKQTRKRLQPEVHYTPTDDNPLHREATREAYKPGDGFQQIHAPDENGVVRLMAYPGRGLLRVVLQAPETPYLPVGETKEIEENMRIDINFGFASLSHAYAIIQPNAEDDVVELELEADPGYSATGRLIDAGGQPIAGARALNLSYNAFYDGHSNETWRDDLNEDAFTIHLIEPGKPRLLAFVHNDRKLIGMTTAKAGEPLEDVVLRSWGAVTGVVTDADGKPLADVDVEVDYPEKLAAGRWPARPNAKTDASGRFVMGRLIPGLSHKLMVKPSGEFSAKELDGIQPDVGQTVDAGEIRLSKTAAE